MAFTVCFYNTQLHLDVLLFFYYVKFEYENFLEIKRSVLVNKHMILSYLF